MPESKIKTIFLDIGGVLLTNGWDTDSRKKAIATFGLDELDFEKRHAMAFDIYERGRMTLDTYLDNVLFYVERSFTHDEFRDFMLDQSQALPRALEFFHEVKAKSGLHFIALNNEPRELNTYRIKKFRLDSLFDCFISSCYIGMRKPDPQMYRMACEIAAVEPSEGLYIDDRAYYMPMAAKIGLNCLHYTGIEEARGEFKKYGYNI